MSAALFRVVACPTAALQRTIVAVAIAATCSGLAGCGQRGPLYLPKLPADAPPRAAGASPVESLPPANQAQTVPQTATEQSGPFIIPISPTTPVVP